MPVRDCPLVAARLVHSSAAMSQEGDAIVTLPVTSMGTVVRMYSCHLIAQINGINFAFNVYEYTLYHYALFCSGKKARSFTAMC